LSVQEKAILQKVMLASLLALQQGRRLWHLLTRLQLVATWNLHTTQWNTLLPTYDEVVNLTGLLETKVWAYRVESNSNMQVKKTMRVK
jgi:hypothetical protein